MAENADHRKLAAILCADVKGYSKLMGEDEPYTVGALKECRNLFAENIQNRGGRVVNAPGDSILAEFPSVVSAVQCAVEIQNQLENRNTDLPDDRKMVFRIGVNLGDVIQSEDAIYGDGVNIGARLEGLAEPGGVSISKTVFDHVQKKLPYGYEYQGEHRAKNITNPVKAYKLLTAPEDAGKLVRKEPTVSASKWIWPTVVVAAIIVTLISYQVYQEIVGPKTEPASVEKMALPLPDKPSIAVLPFVNMSGDPDQEYFSDGMTEDLITDLSHISGLFVIGRSTTFAYKGKSVEIRRFAEELGVRYVLEGSVRKASNRIRVNAQLIDATTGHHLWAERYDGKFGDIFELQDRINRMIVSALAVKLTLVEQRKLSSKITGNVEVYDKFLRGLEHYRQNTPDDWAKAVSFFKETIELDPEHGRSYAQLSKIYGQAATEFLFALVYDTKWSKALNVSYDEAEDLSYTYLQLANKHPTSLYYWIASMRSLEYRNFETAIAEAGQGLALDPNNPEILLQMAKILVFAARPEESVEFAERAKRLNPRFRNPDYFWVSGMAQFAMDNLEEATALFEKAHKMNPDEKWYSLPLAATYSLLGLDQQAKETIESIQTTEWHYRPFLTSTIMLYLPFKDSSVARRFSDGLRKAGLK